MNALIIGRGAKVWEEVAAAKALGPFHQLICINVAGVDYPEAFHHWVSFHPDLFPHWFSQRRAKGYPGSFRLWGAIFRGKKLGEAFTQKTGIQLNYVDCRGGSSGFMGVQVALAIGSDKIVLAGIPLAPTARYDDAKPWDEGEVYRGVWKEDQKKLMGKVKSMSGWTRELLGEPTKEWLCG